MRRRYKAGLSLAAVSTAMGIGMMAGRRIESRKSIVHKMKDAISELRD